MIHRVNLSLRTISRRRRPKKGSLPEGGGTAGDGGSKNLMVPTKVALAQKAIHAAARANIPHLCADPRTWKAGTVTSFPPWGNVLFLPREKKYQKGALRSRLLPHDASVKRETFIAARGASLPLADSKPVENISSLQEPDTLLSACLVKGHI